MILKRVERFWGRNGPYPDEKKWLLFINVLDLNDQSISLGLFYFFVKYLRSNPAEQFALWYRYQIPATSSIH